MFVQAVPGPVPFRIVSSTGGGPTLSRFCSRMRVLYVRSGLKLLLLDGCVYVDGRVLFLGCCVLRAWDACSGMARHPSTFGMLFPFNFPNRFDLAR